MPKTSGAGTVAREKLERVGRQGPGDCRGPASDAVCSRRGVFWNSPLASDTLHKLATFRTSEFTLATIRPSRVPMTSSFRQNS